MMPSSTDLERSTPEQQGIASATILQFVEAVENEIRELHSFMLLRHGQVIAEGWWSPYERERRHMMFSLSKSFTSTAVGLAVSEGRFSVDDHVVSFFPEETPDGASDFLAAMRVRHLLSMATGHQNDTWPIMTAREDGNWIKAFLEEPVTYAPGTHFLYNTGATYMLAAIVQKTTGMKLIDYLEPRLFGPLGILNAMWDESPQGIAFGGIGLSIKTEDIARFGQLYLQKGRWQGQQLLPEAWIAEASACHISTGNDPKSDWTQGYGYQFWQCRHGAYRGDGAFGQYCIIMPEQDAVLAITGGVDAMEMQQPLNLAWDILLLAMGAEPLAEDANSHKRLTEMLAHLRLDPVKGNGDSPFAAQVSGRRFQFDANEARLDSIHFNFSETDCIVRVRRAGREEEETILCGFGAWQQGETALFNMPWLVEPAPIVASSAWTADDCFMMVVRLIEAPFVHTLSFHFTGEQLMVEAQVNASFGSMEPVLLTAYPVY